MIIVTGSLAYDIILNLPGKFSSYILPEKIHQINVSFATDIHRRNFGGTAGNQAYSLALLGERPVLVGTVGNDFDPYFAFLKKHGIETSFIKVIENKLSASGFAITDDVNNQIWGYSKSAMSDAKNLSLKPAVTALSKKNKDLLVVITPNDPDAMANYVDECISLHVPFAFDPAFYIPVLSVATLKKGIQHATAIFGNDYEIELLKSKLKITNYELRKDQILITTLGEKGSQILSNGKKIAIKPASIKKVVDPTGAGDAYRSGFLVGYVNGLPLNVCGQMGSVASSFVVEQYGTVNHHYSLDEFKDRYKKNFGELPDKR